jgi:hypothetical protein
MPIIIQQELHLNRLENFRLPFTSPPIGNHTGGITSFGSDPFNEFVRGGEYCPTAPISG